MRLSQCVGGDVFQLLEHFRHHALPNLQISRFDVDTVDGFGARGAHTQVVMIIPTLVAELHLHQFITDPSEVDDVQSGNLQSVRAWMLWQVKIIINEGFFRLKWRVHI